MNKFGRKMLAMLMVLVMVIGTIMILSENKSESAVLGTAGSNGIETPAQNNGNEGVKAIGPPQWFTRAPMPTPRAQISIVTGDNGLIYAIGGYNGTGVLTTVEAYNPITNTWTTKASLPVATRGAAAAKGIDGRIYVFGGTVGSTQIYNTTTDAWVLGAPMPTPSCEAGAATFSDGRIVVLGGESGSVAINATQIYTPGTNSWSLGANMPTARLGLGVVRAHNNNLYAISGYNSGLGGVQNVVELYTSSNTWFSAATIPTSRLEFGTALGSDSRIYTFGGSTAYNDGVPPYMNTVEVYNLTSNSWTSGTPLLTPRRELGAAADLAGNIYVIGGCNGTYLGTNEQYRFDLLPPTGSVIIDGGALTTNSTIVTLLLSSTDTSLSNLAPISSSPGYTGLGESFKAVSTVILDATVHIPGTVTINITVGIRSEMNGADLGNFTILTSEIPAGGGFVNKPFPTPIPTVIGNTYYLMVYNSSMTDSYSWTGPTFSPGECLYNRGAGWGVDPNYDIPFILNFTPVKMQFSNNGADWSIAETYSSTKSWELTLDGVSGSERNKTVYVRYMDYSGNWGGPFTDNITLYFKPEEKGFLGLSNTIWLAIGALIALIIIILIVVLLVRKRKKKEAEEFPGVAAPPEVARPFAPPSPPTVISGLRSMVAQAPTVCNICMDTIEKGDKMIVCPQCGKTYHVNCAAKTKSCPKCGMDITPAMPAGEPELPRY